MIKQKILLIAVLALLVPQVTLQAQVSGKIAPPDKVSPNSTYCNPVNIGYCFRPDGETGREAADPVIVPFQGDYFLFPSKSAGYWWSSDLINWNLVPSNDNYSYFGDGEHRPTEDPEKDLPVWGYNPAATVVDGKLIYGQQTDPIYQLTDPKRGAFERVRDRLPVSNDEWLFTDDDGKVYLYAVGFKPVRGIYVYELDPKNNLRTVRGPEPCMPDGYIQSDSIGYYRIAPNPPGPLMPIANKTGEGALMTKRNDLYHLQISVLNLPFYCDIAYTSRSPWGPFNYSPANPVSYRPVGFGGGGGNSGTFTDNKGNDWRVVTADVSVYHMFERRVALYPAGVDRDSMLYTDTYLGDLPQYGVGHRKSGLGGNLVGWMLLSYKKQASSSSLLEDRPIEAAFDNNIRTWWSAKTGNKGEWLAVDLGKTCRINAIQVNFAEQDATARKRRIEDELYHQYTLEISDDGLNWEILTDKSANQKDVPHDYIQLEKPAYTRHLRITNIHMAAHGKFAIRDLRVFGSGLGKTPSEVKSSVVKLQSKDNIKTAIEALVEWPPAEGATGYVVRWGYAKNKLYHSQDALENKAVISTLTKGMNYYFVVDSFNDSGVTFGKNIIGLQ